MHRVNLLFLGESGVGKSCWINSFANYLTYDSLEQAVQAGGKFPIDCWVEAMHPKTSLLTRLSSKCDAKQAGMVDRGQSVTQSPGEYVFRLRDTEIALIDTPGLLDTRDVGKSGRRKDEAHISSIFKLISCYQEIHAIFIVLKANENRLSESFQYVLSELFKRLDKEASKNVIFIATFASSSRMKADGILPVICQFVKNKQLDIPLPPEKENIFCFENTAIQHLLERNHGIPCDDQDMFDEFYWKASAEKTSKMFEYIRSLTPFAPTHISNMRMISVLQHAAVDAILCIDADKHNREDALRNKRSAIALTNTSVEHVRLGYRNVVCESSTCGKYVNKQFVYPQVCCTNCDSPWLYWCSRMTWWSSSCKVCGCPKDDHRQRTSITKIKVTNEEPIEDEKVSQACHDDISKYENEMNQILTICAKLQAHVEQTRLLESTGDDQLLQDFQNKLRICKLSDANTSAEEQRLQEIISTYTKICAKRSQCDKSSVPKLFKELQTLRGREFSDVIENEEQATREAAERAKRSTLYVPLGNKLASTVNEVGKYFKALMQSS